MIEKDLIKFIRKSFNQPDIPLKGVMKKRGTNFAFLQFADMEQMKTFQDKYYLEILPKSPKMKIREVTKKMNGKEFKVVKGEEEMKEEEERRKENRVASAEEIAEEMKISVEERVTPYYKMTYEEQIQKKTEQLTDILKSFSTQITKDLKNSDEQMPSWYTKELQDMGMPCKLSHIIECDEGFRDQYRNKVEFTIGKRYEDNEICVGFNKGNLNKGITFVDYPDNIKAISHQSIQAAKTLEAYVKQSGIEPYDRRINQGYWRILLYRESKQTKEVLISVIVSSNYLAVDETTQKKVEEDLVKLFPVG